MKKNLAFAALALLSVMAFGQADQKNGTVTVAHKRVSSWRVKGHVTRTGSYVPPHTDHGKVYRGIS